MENPAVNKTHDCARFCKIRCSDFRLDSPLNKECIEAIDHCKCRPIWKDPAFWLVAGAIFAVFVTIGRLIYMYFKDRREKNARALNVGQGLTPPAATTSAAKEAREPEPSGAKTALPAAQSIVVESSVAENPL